MSSDPTAIILDLSTALDEITAALEPLLKTSLEERLESVTDGLEKAKLQVTMAYVVHDLIWIYLKSVGVDPATHPVMTELERVKTYFGKLHSAENKDAPRTKLDTEAAGRFIRAAIGSGKSNAAPVHTRFQAEVDELLADKDEEEDTAGAEAEADVEADMVIDETRSTKSVLSKRPKLDPFAGYDSPQTKKTKKSKEKRALTEVIEAASSVVSSPAPLSKQQKKLAYKKEKKDNSDAAAI